jgi:membrane protease YdiL (CAAX protease family)
MSDQPPPLNSGTRHLRSEDDRLLSSVTPPEGAPPLGVEEDTPLDLPPPTSPPPPQPEREAFWNYSDLALFVVMAIPSMFVGGLLALQWVKAAITVLHIHSRIPAIEPLAEQLGGDAILFGVLALILRLQYDRPLWRSLGWRPPRIPIPLLVVVICGLLCAVGAALLGSLIRIPTTSNPMVELMKNRPSAILMACFGVTIAPLTEELVFRGFLQPLLVRSLGAVPGILLAAVPFGLLHYHEYGNSWRHAILIGLAGAAFGWMRHRTGSTQASTLMHASYNALIFFAVL